MWERDQNSVLRGVHDRRHGAGGEPMGVVSAAATAANTTTDETSVASAEDDAGVGISFG